MVVLKGKQVSGVGCVFSLSLSLCVEAAVTTLPSADDDGFIYLSADGCVTGPFLLPSSLIRQTVYVEEDDGSFSIFE